MDYEDDQMEPSPGQESHDMEDMEGELDYEGEEEPSVMTDEQVAEDQEAQ